MPRQHPAVWIKGRGRHPATATTHGAVASCAMRNRHGFRVRGGGSGPTANKGGQFAADLPLLFRSRDRGGLRSYMGGAGNVQRRTGPSEPFGPPDPQAGYPAEHFSNHPPRSASGSPASGRCGPEVCPKSPVAKALAGAGTSIRRRP